MCVDKFRDIKQTSTNINGPTLTTSYQKVFSPNPYRRLLVCNPPASNVLGVNFVQGPPTQVVVNVPAGADPYVFDFAQWGTVMCGEIWALLSAASGIVWFTEVTDLERNREEEF